jgi:hypothetical protein
LPFVLCKQDDNISTKCNVTKSGDKNPSFEEISYFPTSNTCISDLYKNKEATPFASISRLQNFEKVLESFLKVDSIWESTSGERSEECLDKKCAYRWQTE